MEYLKQYITASKFKKKSESILKTLKIFPQIFMTFFEILNRYLSKFCTILMKILQNFNFAKDSRRTL